MAFFRPNVLSPYTAHHQHYQQAEPSFHGLFRLLEDWDSHHNTTSQSYQPAKGPCHRAVRRQQPAFTPRFDVQETESAYELHGELPGVQKKDINIEFSDPQTLVIRGSVERSFTTTQDNEGNLITSPSFASSEVGDDDEGVLVVHDEDTTTTANISAAANTDTHSETASQRSFKATVEDDIEEHNTPATTTASTLASASEKNTNHQNGSEKNGTTTTTASASAESSHAAANVQSRRQTEQSESSSARFWFSERSVGTFSRTFEFPERIEIDNVSAGLEDGILSLRVPKAKKFGARQISVL